MEVQRLAAIPLFATLPGQELAAVASCAGEQEVDAGAILVREGEFGHCIYAVESGPSSSGTSGRWRTRLLRRRDGFAS
jgi:CRP-like cAMP-binding protein